MNDQWNVTCLKWIFTDFKYGRCYENSVYSFMVRNLSALLFLYIYMAVCPASGSVFYVDPGNGGSNASTGVLGMPWATIQKAATTAQAGDTVYVQSGTYAEKVVFSNSGTEDAYITFIGVGNVVVEEPANTAVWSGTFNLNTKNYIRIQNFSIQNAYWFGIYVEACNHVYLENNKTYNTGASGISVWHSSYVYAGYNTVRKACYQSLSTGSQECITFSGVSNFEIHHNEVYESGGSTNGGEGIDTKEDCSFGNVYSNNVHDLIRLGIYADSWDKTLHHIDIYNNRVYKCGDGIILSSENGGTVTDVNVYNNLTYNNDNFGIVISDYDKDGPRKNINIMNNTVYNNGFGDNNTAWGGGIMVYTSNIYNISIFNNIVAFNDAMQISNQSKIVPVAISYNLIYGYRGLNWTSEVKGMNAVEADPLFVDVDGADNIQGTADDNLNVTATSPAINAGINTNAPAFDFNHDARPAEGTVDLGAFEANSIFLGSKKTASVIEPAILVQVYPNPSTGYFNLKLLKKVDRIEIVDATGAIIQNIVGPQETIIKVCLTKSGLYLVRVYAGDACQVYKAINSNE